MTEKTYSLPEVIEASKEKEAPEETPKKDNFIHYHYLDEDTYLCGTPVRYDAPTESGWVNKPNICPECRRIANMINRNHRGRKE